MNLSLNEKMASMLKTLSPREELIARFIVG
jgi:hypothetical protein